MELSQGLGDISDPVYVSVVDAIDGGYVAAVFFACLFAISLVVSLVVSGILLYQNRTKSLTGTAVEVRDEVEMAQ